MTFGEALELSKQNGLSYHRVMGSKKPWAWCKDGIAYSLRSEDLEASDWEETKTGCEAYSGAEAVRPVQIIWSEDVPTEDGYYYIENFEEGVPEGVFIASRAGGTWYDGDGNHLDVEENDFLFGPRIPHPLNLVDITEKAALYDWFIKHQHSFHKRSLGGAWVNYSGDSHVSDNIDEIIRVLSKKKSAQ